MSKTLKIMFLGGVGEIGKNLTAIEYEDEIVVIDCGLSFPSADMPGVDIVIPDTSYLKANKNKVKAILLTHGHEDHIGGVPYLLREVNAPVYGSALTLALLENKLKENKVENPKLKTIGNKSVVKLGKFAAEFLQVSHSVAGSMAIVLTTPIGIVFLTGDFKIDHTPLAGDIMDLNRIAEIGRKGVLLLMCESTNVERPGYTMSEAVVGEALDRLFDEAADRRIIIATFASNVDRVQQILDLAVKYKRKVAVSGRSMLNVIDAATRVGIVKYKPDLLIDVDQLPKIPDKNLLILSTGSQGEPMSALTRMANGDYHKIKIGENDTIIISASPIPGNERDVYKVINNLYRLGARVIYDRLNEVHVSGHACQEELKLMYRLTNPKFFIPIHGEFRHLKQHSRLVSKLGLPDKNIVVAEIGDVIELEQDRIAKKGSVPSGNILVDGLSIGDVGNVVLRDRLTLSADGLVLVVVGISTAKGVVTTGPEIISRGFVYNTAGGNDETIDTMKNIVINVLKEMDLKELNIGQAKHEIQRALRNYLSRKLKRNPMILPVIVEG